MATASPIGSLIGYAVTTAASLQFEMDKTYKARLAKHIKELVQQEEHHGDIRLAIRRLLEKRLSPALLGAMLGDIAKEHSFPEEPNPDAPFPDQRPDISRLLEPDHACD